MSFFISQESIAVDIIRPVCNDVSPKTYSLTESVDKTNMRGNRLRQASGTEPIKHRRAIKQQPFKQRLIGSNASDNNDFNKIYTSD